MISDRGSARRTSECEFGIYLAESLLGRRFIVPNEAILQAAIAGQLEADRIPFEREVKLTERDRIDFLVAGTLGLELKVAGAPNTIHRQLKRYARSGKLSQIILATTLRKHAIIQAQWDPRAIPLEIVVLHGGSI